MSNVPIVSFNKGLVTPHIDARIDSEQYQSACRVLNNFIARMYGSAERRPGTYYVNTMRDSDTPTTISGVTTCLLVPFIYSREIAYVLEFTGYYIRIYYDDAVVDEIDSPYAESDLFELQFKQLGDVIWITHEDYPPAKFSRISATEFVIENIVFNDGPFLVRNDIAVRNGITLTLAGAGLDSTSDADCVYNASVNPTHAYKAFDQNSVSYWGAHGANWVSCQWDDAETFVRMRIKQSNIKTLRIQGSNNGTDWTTLTATAWVGEGQQSGTTDTLLNFAANLQWVDITFTNTDTYTYYRAYALTVWVDWHDNAIAIYEIQLTDEAVPAANDDAIITASDDLFESTHVGALFAITQPRVDSALEFSITSETTSDEILVEDAWTLSVGTGWEGIIELQRKIESEGTWETVKQWKCGDSLRAIQMGGYEEEIDAYYRIEVTTYNAGTVAGELTVDKPTHTGICRVLTVESATSVTVEILKDFVSTTTSARWYEGCWSDKRGYPSSSTFLEDRCVYGGMKMLANDTSLATVWLSATGDYEDFDEGTNGADSFSITIATTETLQWVEAMDSLIVGTTGGTFFVRSSKMDTAIVPNPPPICRQQSAYPCDRVRPMKMMKTMVYLSGRQLRELAYDRNSYASDDDLTSLCEQITHSPIVHMTLQTNPDTVLWCTHTDGSSSAFVYDRENDVLAWANMPLAPSGGEDPRVKSMCVIPDLGSGDDIYVAVNRTITGRTVVDGSDTVYDGDEIVTDKSYPIYVEKFAKRFE